MYSIKAVSKATGLSVGTLRAWERRYRVVAPVRDASGRRNYGPQDVLRLTRLREGTEQGHPIGRLAALSDEALDELLAAAPSRERGRPGAALVQRILAAALDFRTAECEQALALAIAVLPARDLIREVLQPLLLEVGDRWRRGEFSISQERLVSSCVRRHLGVLLETFDRNATRQPLVFATLPGERHELGLLMSALLCAGHGFKIHCLGTELPPGEIARFARETGSAVVALSVVLPDPQDRLLAQIASLAAELGSDSTIWIGGRGSGPLRQARLPAGCVVLADQRDLERRLELLQVA